MLVNFEVDLILIEYPFTCVFISLQIPLIIFAVIFGVYLYYTGGVWRLKKCSYALKNALINGPHDSNRCEKMMKIKINLHVETKNGKNTFRHDPIIIDNVQLVLIPAASTITMDE